MVLSQYDAEVQGMDLTDQIWPDAQFEPVTDHGSSHQGLRTLSGLLDLLHHVEENLEGWIDRESEHGEGHRLRGRAAAPIVLQTYNRAAAKWDGRTYAVDGQKLIAEIRQGRYRVVVTNNSTADISVSAVAGSTFQGMNTVLIPGVGPDATKTGRSNTRIFFTEGQLYAYPAVTGTAQAVDVQDEFTTPE